MLMTASTFPNAPLYFGKSGPNTLLNWLQVSANCCFISAGRMLDGSILISSCSFVAFFLVGVAGESVMVSGSTMAND